MSCIGGGIKNIFGLVTQSDSKSLSLMDIEPAIYLDPRISPMASSAYLRTTTRILVIVWIVGVVIERHRLEYLFAGSRFLSSPCVMKTVMNSFAFTALFSFCRAFLSEPTRKTTSGKGWSDKIELLTI
jgi:hypothetical protein